MPLRIKGLQLGVKDGIAPGLALSRRREDPIFWSQQQNARMPRGTLPAYLPRHFRSAAERAILGLAMGFAINRPWADNSYQTATGGTPP
jgi:hypothetical protein